METENPLSSGKAKRGLSEIIHSFSGPVYKLKAIGELFFVEAAGDEKYLNADASNGVSNLLNDIANEIETLSNEIRFKLSTQILEEIEREKAALKAKVPA